MVVADLHVHTRHSDGKLSLADLPAAATRAGLEAVAVTDHDRTNPGFDSPVVVRDGVTLIHGIELRVAAEERVDLLGYGVEPTPALESELDRLQADRLRRAAAIIECIEDRLGIDLDLEPRAGLGRPHIARAIADHPDVPFDVQGAFDQLIGEDDPCYVARDVPSFERGRMLLEEASAVVGLAHPGRYEDPATAIARARELDAIERWYPYDAAIDPAAIDRAIDEFDLVPTGGSDAHGTTLGRAGMPLDAYTRFRQRLPMP